MGKVYCFNKKKIHSVQKGKDFYFLCVRDSDGYSGDQIVSEKVYSAVTPPCELDVSLSCAGSRPFISFSLIKG